MRKGWHFYIPAFVVVLTGILKIFMIVLHETHIN